MGWRTGSEEGEGEWLLILMLRRLCFFAVILSVIGLTYMSVLLSES